MKKLFTVAIAVLFCASSMLRAELRDWTRASDGKKISAEYVGMKDESTVQIKMANGNQFDVPLSGLSEADRDYINGLKTADKKEMATSGGTGEPAAIPEGETTVTLSGVHLSCGECEDAITGIPANEEVKVDPAVKYVVDSKAGTVTITAPTGKAAKTAVDAVSRIGFYGVSDHPSIKIAELKDEAFLSDTMRVRGVQLFCRKCIKEFEKAVESVKGVEEVEAKIGATAIQVTGEGFDCNAVIKALREAGFSATFS
ncbi:MAG: SHD1 domain-containing protein [Verrucomicrobiales bacterium]|nr:SHD1 domain-containing protein [Verrucomicrobiales bacterium]